MSKIRFIFKTYAKILSFVCILWMIAACWYYFVPYSDSMERFKVITNWRIPLYMRYLHILKQVLYQMKWVPIVLLPCTIFLFYWIGGKAKIENTTNEDVERKEIPNETEASELTELKTSETEQGKETFDLEKAMEGVACKHRRKKNARL